MSSGELAAFVCHHNCLLEITQDTLSHEKQINFQSVLNDYELNISELLTVGGAKQGI